MATRIESLFGIQSPQESYQNYLGGLMVSPQQMGSQGLYQQLISTMANAGALGGASLGRMMGGRTSEEVRSATIQDAFKSVSGQKFENDWEKFDALAKELESKGMYDDAMRARKEARTMEATGLATQKARKDLRETPKIVNRSKLVLSSNPAEAALGKMVQTTESFIEYKGSLYSFEEFQKQHPELAKGLSPAQAAGATGAGATDPGLAGAAAALAKRQQAQQAGGEGQPPAQTPPPPSTEAQLRKEAEMKGGDISGTSPFAGKTRQEQRADFIAKYKNATSTSEQMAFATQALRRGLITQEELTALMKSVGSGNIPNAVPPTTPRTRPSFESSPDIGGA